MSYTVERLRASDRRQRTAPGGTTVPAQPTLFSVAADEIESLRRELDEARAGERAEEALANRRGEANATLRAALKNAAQERDDAVARLRAWAAEDRDEHCACCGPLRAEVERLTRALLDIVNEGCSETGSFSDYKVTKTCLQREDDDPCPACRARAALAEENSND